MNPAVKINYSSVGSGTGIKQISDKSTDFGASDAPMNDKQLAEAKGGELLHIPMTLGAVVPIYNVPGVTKTLVFSCPVIADIHPEQVVLRAVGDRGCERGTRRTRARHRRRRPDAASAGRSSNVDHQRAGGQRLSDFGVHLPAGLPRTGRCDQGQGAGAVSQVGR